jgi:hypothetical protein
VRVGTRSCQRPSEGRACVRDKRGSEKERAYLLRALLLSEYFVLLRDDLCFVL